MSRLTRRQALRSKCPSGKRRFKTLEQAEQRLAEIQADPSPRRAKDPQRAYECALCAGAHLTSRPYRMPARSKKAERIYRTERRPLVERLLAERPVCEIRWDDGCTFWATEVDEIVGRGRGGDFLDEDNCQTGCHYCHHMKTTNPAEARRRGLERHSWAKEATA